MIFVPDPAMRTQVFLVLCAASALSFGASHPASAQMRWSDASGGSAAVESPNTAGVALVQLPADTTPDDSTVFQRLAARGWTLQRAVAGKGSTEGASFGFVSKAHEATVFSADFALIYEPERPCSARTCVATQISMEGHVASDEAAAQNAWRLRGRWRIDRGSTTGFRGTTTYVGAKFEASQDFTTQKVMGEAVLTYTDSRYGIGFLIPPRTATSRPALRFRWRPFLGVDAGGTLRSGEGNEDKSTVLRIVPRARVELFFDALSSALGVQHIDLNVDDTAYFLPLEDSRRGRNLLVGGLEIQFNEHVGVQFEYTNGEAAPEFERVNTLTGGLSVRFGKSRLRF